MDRPEALLAANGPYFLTNPWCRLRAAVSGLSRWAGPQVASSPVALLRAYTALDLATHSFQIHRACPASPVVCDAAMAA